MKKLIAILLSLTLVCLLCACNMNAVSEKMEEKLEDSGVLETTPATEEGEEATFTVIVVHKDGTEKTFTYTTTETFVGPVLEGEGLIQGNAGPYGMEITHVDGEQAIYETDKAYWALYEEDEYVMQGIDTTPVVDGRTYKLVYEAA